MNKKLEQKYEKIINNNDIYVKLNDVLNIIIKNGSEAKLKFDKINEVEYKSDLDKLEDLSKEMGKIANTSVLVETIIQEFGEKINIDIKEKNNDCK